MAISDADFKDILVRINVSRGVALDTLNVRLLWDLLESLTLSSEKDLILMETVKRVIDLRTPVDGWFQGQLGDFFIDSDLGVAAGAGTFTKDVNGSLVYDENAVPNGAMVSTVTPPARWQLELIDANMIVSASAATYTMNMSTQSGVAVAGLIDELLNLQKFWRSEANVNMLTVGARFGSETYASYIRIASSVEMGATVQLKLEGQCRWRRQPKWIMRT